MSAHAGHRPLVVFTSLAIAGAGLVAASGYLGLVHRGVPASALAAGAMLLGTGLVVSLGHLGQRTRAGLALRGAGRSALSNEALLAGVALAAAALAAGLDMAGAHAPAATAVAAAVNAAFLLSVGAVYRLGGQLTWRGFSTLTPLSGGLAFGVIAVQSMLGPGGAGVSRGTLVLIAIDAFVFLQRWREVASVPLPPARLADPRLARRDQLLGARFFLLDVVPPFLMIAWPTPLAAAIAAAGVVADRIGFYALAIRHDTEHELAAVEARIAVLDRPAQD